MFIFPPPEQRFDRQLDVDDRPMLMPGRSMIDALLGRSIGTYRFPTTPATDRQLMAFCDTRAQSPKTIERREKGKRRHERRKASAHKADRLTKKQASRIARKARLAALKTIQKNLFEALKKTFPASYT